MDEMLPADDLVDDTAVDEQVWGLQIHKAPNGAVYVRLRDVIDFCHTSSNMTMDIENDLRALLRRESA